MWNLLKNGKMNVLSEKSKFNKWKNEWTNEDNERKINVMSKELM